MSIILCSSFQETTSDFFAMARQIIDGAVRSLRNAFEATERADFNEATLAQVQARMEYLFETFDRFTQNHRELIL